MQYLRSLILIIFLFLSAFFSSACGQEYYFIDIEPSIDLPTYNHGVSCMDEEIFMRSGYAIEEAALSGYFETEEYSQEGWVGFKLRFAAQANYSTHINCYYKGEVRPNDKVFLPGESDFSIPVYRGIWVVRIEVDGSLLESTIPRHLSEER